MILSSGVRLLRRTTYVNSLAARYGCRTIATERTNYVSVTIDPEFDGSVAVVKMQKKPVNSLCPNHARELIKTVNDLENNENMRAMIITSAFPGIFCAGLDMKFILGATYDDIYTLFGALQDLILTTYGSRLITIAAVNGHCVAGGNALALGADYRVMAEGAYRIGLNEVKLGTHIPFYLTQMMINLIGTRKTARALQLATLFTSEEACKMGLVEEVVPLDQVLTAAKRELKQWLEIPDSARTLVKKEIRRKEIQELIDRREEDARTCASLITSRNVQELMRAAVDNLKN